MKTISQMHSEMKEAFQAAGLDTPELDARLLVQHVLGLSLEELFLRNQLEISESEENALKEYMLRRLERTPVSRIIGQRSFWKSDFKISSETLDPRADSETLIEAALRFGPKDSALRLLDLGTGSGCLLISLLQEWPQATGAGLDISSDAVMTARQNAGDLGIADRADFVATDWERFTPEQLFDIVISNPPYIAEHEVSGLAPEVVGHDPVRALVAGVDGLECYRSIIRILPRLLKSGGLVLFEIGYKQAKEVTELLAQGGLTVLQTFTDLAGNDRVVVAKMP